jgi:hypothetical protein
VDWTRLGVRRGQCLNKDLISDAARNALGVPSLAAQQTELQKENAAAKA